MITKMLAVFLVVAAVLAAGFWLESRREKNLRAWVARRPGVQLFWPFVPAEHPGFPADELAGRLLGRPPMGWGSAVREVRDGEEFWWVEFRATPAARKSPSWFHLAARRRPGGGWHCLQREGLLSGTALGEVWESPPPNPSPP